MGRLPRLVGCDAAPESAWEDLWRSVHRLRRQIALEMNPLAQVGPLLFVKASPARSAIS
jgi:hypothetical protein